jgi:hypothetical protein
MGPRMLLKLLAVSCLLFIGCVAGPNAAARTPNADGIVAGFWRGLWHGSIVPVTFVVSLFSSKLEVYEVHNNGGWYNFGFLTGLSAVFGGGAGGAATRSRSRR